MCRLLGIASSEPAAFRVLLREAPRSMAALSERHPDGWGIAVYDDALPDGWLVQKEARCAKLDESFHRTALGARGTLLIAHIRQMTVGRSSIDNTHPFRRGPWVFAHNGTVKDVAYLRANASAARTAENRGETDSEALFAYLLTRFDEAGITAPADRDSDRADALLTETMRMLRARPDFGAFNFLLSDGAVTYAHRFGRTLFLLERRPDDEAIDSRRSRDGTEVIAPWSSRRHAVFLASEQLTDEPWEEVREGSFLRIDRLPIPSCRVLD